MKEMDKILRSKLYDHPSELPNGLWEKIEAGLGDEGKRRGFAWIWLGLLGIGLVLGSGLVYNGYSSNPQSPKTDFTAAIDASEENGDIKLVTQPTHENLEAIENEASSEQNKIDNDKNPEDQLKSETTKDLLPRIQEGKTGVSTSIYFDQLSSEKPINNSITEAVDQSNEELQNSEVVPLKHTSKAGVDEFSRLQIHFPGLLTDNRNFDDPVGCPSFSKRYRPNLFIEGYYQPLYAYAQLSSNSPEIGSEYLNARRDTERPLYSWSAGVNIGWISDYNVGVKAGFDYEEINERFTYEDPDAIRNQTVIVIDTIFNNDGSITINSDTSVVQVSGSELQQIYNYHRSLSIPIQALYQMNFDNFALEFSGGPIFNIQYNNRGKVIDPSNDDQWFTNGESSSYNVFKERLSVSFVLSISAMYSINDKIQLFARPQFKFFPGSISTTTSPFNQRYLNTGLAVGARYYFSGNPNY